jgi:predicted DCC family thiol-disulfide oxidoreductase YuxK
MPQGPARENPCRGVRWPQLDGMTLHILYNGGCPICAREIAHYQRLAERHGAQIQFDDLRETELARWSLESDAAMRRLHAMAGETRLDGLEAFRALWSRLPWWRWAARITGLPLIRPATALVYDRLLAQWLYRRNARACRASTDGACLHKPGP